MDLSRYDPHVVSGVLKEFLRELPEPLLTFEHYDGFLAADGTIHFTFNLKLVCLKFFFVHF
jgi:hypothetical protein